MRVMKTMANTMMGIAIFLFIVMALIMGLEYYKIYKKFDGGNIEYGKTTAQWERFSKTRKEESRTDSDGDTYYEYVDYYVDYYVFEVHGETYEAHDDTRVYSERDKETYIGSNKTIYYNPDKPTEYSFTVGSFEEAVENNLEVSKILFIILSPYFIIALVGWILAHLIGRKKARA